MSGSIMNDEVLVSIIIPVYNSEKYLYNTLKTVEKQSYKNIEVIIINDGSTDNSGKIIDEYCVRNSNFYSITLKNGGVSRARNKGLELAKGMKIYFMDSDDELEPDAVERLVVNGISNDMQICGVYIEYPQDSRQIKLSREERCLNSRNEIAMFLESIRIEDKGIYLDYLWNRLFSKSIIDAYGLRFDENLCLGEDFVFVTTYMQHISSIGITAECLYHYYCRNGSSLANRFDINELPRRRIMKQTFIELFDSFDISKEKYNIIFLNEGKNCLVSMGKTRLPSCKLDRKGKIRYIKGFLHNPEKGYMLQYLKEQEGIKAKVLYVLIRFNLADLMFFAFTYFQ